VPLCQSIIVIRGVVADEGKVGFLLAWLHVRGLFLK
jgi:hypothetical protein